jgi:ubiquinone/menaquinone biosynthesis C-methylase UbiE
MLAVARARLGGSARLCIADGRRAPYADHGFDLIVSMLTLHEMPRAIRDDAVTEMKRLLKDSGRILMIDFHTGPYVPLHGWMSKAIIFISEQAAGREHYKNYREFMATKGLTALTAAQGLAVEKQRVLAGGTFAAYLCAA